MHLYVHTIVIFKDLKIYQCSKGKHIKDLNKARVKLEKVE